MTLTRAQADAIGVKVAELAADRAFAWRWDAAHGEVSDPVWARHYAAQLAETHTWLAKDGTVRAGMPGGHFAAYEMLEGAASAVLSPAEWDAAEMDWTGAKIDGRYLPGAAVLKVGEV